ncbi:L-lactate dehydrogenase complex protein LldG [Amaricoccus macauensis]|mgnify:CR=1 FL=1|jgi:L-lactate dehydrogenase complex protein LldG|uniref:L-lactate dehydrogenase complex protein LldG n=1 Tax=Amaricoccus macauensis TaxID=57001 RepID=A0A840STQ1_9RHOB|nr:LUD domain-containing protein [Amaricoccus macauensis]MBB5224564.1 L-lactate dehydrogenase complex protein LldG [Amaricoccus macauensis]
MTTRDSILAAVHAGLGGLRAEPDAIAAEAAGLLADLDAIRPRLAAPDPVDAFEIKAAALGTTIERVRHLDDVPAAVGRYLAAQGLPPAAAVQQTAALTALSWEGIAQDMATAPDQPAAVGLARLGIAESGSIVIHSATDSPILLAFLPLHHIVVLHASSVVAHLEDYARLLDGGSQPRNAILITGPSGTTDIEGSYVRGAHGPGFVHVIIVNDRSRA